nr:RidA family protein [Variovorax ginsengisoli]
MPLPSVFPAPPSASAHLFINPSRLYDPRANGYSHVVVDHSEARLAVMSAALRAVWSDGLAPACTLIPVPRLALNGMLVEIDATAVVPLADGVCA